MTKALSIFLCLVCWSVIGSSNALFGQSLDFIGHRGARGLMPENTIPGFLHTLDLGVNAMELDLVISGDSQVVVSHDTYFSAKFCLDPEGDPIEKEKEHLLFQMPYSEIEEYDCGKKPHPGFSNQQKMSVSKPLLSEVFVQVENYARKNGLGPVTYCLELKCLQIERKKRHPSEETFARLVYDEIEKAALNDRVIIFSFNPRALEAIHALDPELPILLLFFAFKSVNTQLNRLNFTPQYLGPRQKLVTPRMIAAAHKRGLKVIPWTVNSVARMQELIDMGVDGLISDYPDRFAKLKPK